MATLQRMEKDGWFLIPVAVKQERIRFRTASFILFGHVRTRLSSGVLWVVIGPDGIARSKPLSRTEAHAKLHGLWSTWYRRNFM